MGSILNPIEAFFLGTAAAAVFVAVAGAIAAVGFVNVAAVGSVNIVDSFAAAFVDGATVAVIAAGVDAVGPRAIHGVAAVDVAWFHAGRRRLCLLIYAC